MSKLGQQKSVDNLDHIAESNQDIIYSDIDITNLYLRMLTHAVRKDTPIGYAENGATIVEVVEEGWDLGYYVLPDHKAYLFNWIIPGKYEIIDTLYSPGIIDSVTKKVKVVTKDAPEGIWYYLVKYKKDGEEKEAWTAADMITPIAPKGVFNTPEEGWTGKTGTEFEKIIEVDNPNKGGQEPSKAWVFEWPEPGNNQVIDELHKGNAEITGVTKKMKVNHPEAGNIWWYFIEYEQYGQKGAGWTYAEWISEIANVKNVEIVHTDKSFGNPMKEMREEIDRRGLREDIVWAINHINLDIAAQLHENSPQGFNYSNVLLWISKDYLINRNGNIADLFLVIAGAYRATKDDKGKYAWINKHGALSLRDKTWHFFWNAFTIFNDKQWEWLQSLKGVLYEVKSNWKVWSLEQEDWDDIYSDLNFNDFGIALGGLLSGESGMKIIQLSVRKAINDRLEQYDNQNPNATLEERSEFLETWIENPANDEIFIRYSNLELIKLITLFYDSALMSND